MIESSELASIRRLRAASNFPVAWCRRWVSDAPRDFVDSLIAGGDCRELILEFANRGINIPCPECGAMLRATQQHGGCPNNCHAIIWTT